MTASLWTLKLSEFRAQTASARPTPGGGSVCAVTASFGLSLVIMALEITRKRAHASALDAAIARAQAVLAELGESADDDVRAFETYLDAAKLPRTTDEQEQARALALRGAAEVATAVPLAAASRSVAALELAVAAGDAVSVHVISDVRAGAELLHASVHGLLATLAMNLETVDAHVRERAIAESEALRARAGQALRQIREGTGERGRESQR